jgi:hypothetical protein
MSRKINSFFQAGGVQKEGDGLRQKVRVGGGVAAERAGRRQLFERVEHERFQRR